MTWQPISFADLQEIVAAEIPDARVELRTLFEEIRITPEKWRLPPWGDLGGGFWVVAVHRDSVLWYNDIEEGFNVAAPFLWGAYYGLISAIRQRGVRWMVISAVLLLHILPGVWLAWTDSAFRSAFELRRLPIVAYLIMAAAALWGLVGVSQIFGERHDLSSSNCAAANASGVLTPVSPLILAARRW